MTSATRWIREVIDYLRGAAERSAIPVAPDRIYGIRDVSATYEGTLEPGAEKLLRPSRCESRKREGSRSWRCTLDAGHPVGLNQPGGGHFNSSGGRRW